MEGLIVNFTPTGMIPTKEQTPFVPVSISEIIETVLMANEKGITIAHLHARDDSGKPTYKAEIYEKIITGIRKYAPELVICVSLSGRNFPEFEKRSEPLFLTGNAKPDMGSLTLSSLNFINGVSINSPNMTVKLAEKMNDLCILPELESFDVGMVNYANYLLKKKVIKNPCYMNLIVGNIASSQMNLLHLSALINGLPEKCIWSLGGIGNYQFQANSIAIALGGGVRVGLEDNIYFVKGVLASNEMLLNRIHELAGIHQRKIVNPSHFRSLLNLKKGNGNYGTLN